MGESGDAGSLTEHNHVVEALPPDRSDHSLHNGLAAASNEASTAPAGCPFFDPLNELATEDAVTIAKQESRRAVTRKCLSELLNCPRGSWMRCDGEVTDPATLVCDHDRDIKHVAMWGRGELSPPVLCELPF
jgi:hypothetical protein